MLLYQLVQEIHSYLTVFGCMFVCFTSNMCSLVAEIFTPKIYRNPNYCKDLEIIWRFAHNFSSAEILQERRRASNTGKLLKLLMPHQTDILVHGVAEDEERLQELISNQDYFCFVVYPSEDAVPVSTISSTLALQKCSKIPVAVLIDGT